MPEARWAGLGRESDWNRDPDTCTLWTGLQAEVPANFADALAHAGQPYTRHAAAVSEAFDKFVGHPPAMIVHLEYNICVVAAEGDFRGCATRMLMDVREGLLDNSE